MVALLPQMSQQQQQSTLLGRLPFEILYAIADGLNVSDQKNCTLVCREWRILFRRILFRVIDTNTRSKFKAFQSTLRSEASQDEQLGPYARHLVVQDGYMTEREMHELKAHCPNLRHLTFMYEHDAAHDNVIGLIREGRRFFGHRRRFGVPRLLMETFPVASLTFQCAKTRTRNVRFPDVEECKIYLSGLSNLHTLVLTHVFPLMSMQLLDLIHTSCPNLTTLRIETHEDGSNPVDFDPDKDLMDKPEEYWVPTGLRHLTVKPLWLTIERLLFWLRCFALKYPRLETLEIDVKKKYFTLSDRNEEAIQICNLLADKCQRLQSITLKNTVLRTDILQIFVSKLNHLQHFTFIKEPVMQSENAILPNESALQRLFTLSLCLDKKLTDYYLTFLRACTRLTSMDLYGYSTQCQLSFFDVMSACPALRSLRLLYFDLTQSEGQDQGQETVTQCSSLSILAFVYCNINRHIMDYVGTYCTKLKRLRLHCCRYEEEGHPVFRVHLPQRHLQTVQICNPTVKMAPGGVPDGSVRLCSMRLGETTSTVSQLSSYADRDATWFSLSRMATRTRRMVKYYGAKCCSQQYTLPGSSCPIKCRTITCPKMLEDIFDKINVLSDNRNHHIACGSKASADPLYENGSWPIDKMWKPAETIFYFGYASLKFGSVKNLRVNGVVKLVTDGQLQVNAYTV